MSRRDVSNVLREVIKGHHTSASVRLGIRIYLSAKSKVYFTELRQVLSLTLGNLNSHLRRLRDTGYVEIIRAFEDRSRTIIKITRIISRDILKINSR